MRTVDVPVLPNDQRVQQTVHEPRQHRLPRRRPHLLVELTVESVVLLAPARHLLRPHALTGRGHRRDLVRDHRRGDQRDRRVRMLTRRRPSEAVAPAGEWSRGRVVAALMLLLLMAVSLAVGVTISAVGYWWFQKSRRGFADVL